MRQRMLKFEHIRPVKKKVEAHLRTYPGVHAVGIGEKYVNGKPSGEPSIVVLVIEKKPLNQLKAEEVIPSEIEGIKTDVIQVPMPRLDMAGDPSNLTVTVACCSRSGSRCVVGVQLFRRGGINSLFQQRPGPAPGRPAASVAKLLRDRLDNVAKINITTAQPADLITVLTTVFGNDFVVLPRFTPPDFTSLQSAFGQSSALVASDPQAPARWLLRLAHVRPGISRLDAALSLAQLLGTQAVSPPTLLPRTVARSRR
jgi:hypothetical protein